MDWHKANEAAIKKRADVMAYAHCEGLASEGIAHVGYRMGYLAGASSVEDEYTHSVIARRGGKYPESRVGTYRTSFEAEAVAAAWNKINMKYGITYRVEVDW